MALLTRCVVSTQPCHCCSPLRIGGGAPAEVLRRPSPFCSALTSHPPLPTRHSLLLALVSPSLPQRSPHQLSPSTPPPPSPVSRCWCPSSLRSRAPVRTAAERRRRRRPHATATRHPPGAAPHARFRRRRFHRRRRRRRSSRCRPRRRRRRRRRRRCRPAALRASCRNNTAAAVRCAHAARRSLRTTHYSLRTTHYSLLTTHYSVLTTQYVPR